MAQLNHTPRLAHTEEALTVLFCLVDEAYAHLNPRAHSYESIKRLADSEVIALAVFQQLRGVESERESERSFLRDVQRFFSHLFPGVAGLYPSSFNRRVSKLRRFLEALRRKILPELIGEPETLLVDSTLLEVLHPPQVSQSAGFAGAFAGGLGRGGHPLGDRAIRAEARNEAANRDRHLEPQEGLRFGRDFGHHPRWAGHEVRGQDLLLHLRFLHQPGVGSSSRSHQGVVGLILKTDI